MEATTTPGVLHTTGREYLADLKWSCDRTGMHRSAVRAWSMGGITKWPAPDDGIPRPGAPVYNPRAVFEVRYLGLLEWLRGETRIEYAWAAWAYLTAVVHATTLITSGQDVTARTLEDRVIFRNHIARGHDQTSEVRTARHILMSAETSTDHDGVTAWSIRPKLPELSEVTFGTERDGDICRALGQAHEAYRWVIVYETDPEYDGEEHDAKEQEASVRASRAVVVLADAARASLLEYAKAPELELETKERS